MQRLNKLSNNELSALKDWLKTIDHLMFDSPSGSAQGRRELHLRHFVKLAGSDKKKTDDEVNPISNIVAQKYNSGLIEEIGERLLPGFHHALVLHYSPGALIKPHRDSRAYAKGAASVNLIGEATFLISDGQDAANMRPHQLSEGDCIRFDNKQPHAIAKVKRDRWCVCFFYLKEEYLPNHASQLALFPSVQTPKQDFPDKSVQVSRQEVVTAQVATQKPKNTVGTDGIPFTKPRYTWIDQPMTAKWWNLHGEQIAFIRHLETREEKHGIYKAEDIPDGWGAVLNYGGRAIARDELILVFDPTKEGL